MVGPSGMTVRPRRFLSFCHRIPDVIQLKISVSWNLAQGDTMEKIDQMMTEMNKLSERFLSVDKSAQVSQMDAHLDANDKGVESAQTPPQTINPAPPAAPAQPVDKKTAAGSEGAAPGDTSKEKPQVEATTIVPTITHTVSNMAHGAGMLIRSLKGIEPERVQQAFGEGYGDKMDEMYESMMKVHEYFKPKAQESTVLPGDVLDEKFKVGDVVVRDMKAGEEHKAGAIHLVNPSMKDINTAVESAKQAGHKLVLVQHVKTPGGKIRGEGLEEGFGTEHGKEAPYISPEGHYGEAPHSELAMHTKVAGKPIVQYALFGEPGKDARYAHIKLKDGNWMHGLPREVLPHEVDIKVPAN